MKIFTINISKKIFCLGITFLLFISCNIAGAAQEDPNEGFVATLLGFIMVPLFLLIAFSMALQLTSFLFKPIIGGGKKALSLGKGVGKMGARAIGFGAKGAADVAGGIASAGTGAAKGIKEKKGFGKVGGFFTGASKGILTPRGRAEGKETISKGLRKIPVIGTKWYERQQRPETSKIAAAEENLKNLPDERLQGIASGKVFFKGGLSAQMAAIKLLGKRKSFDFDTTTEQKIITQAKNLGLDLSDLLKSRPDLAPFIKPEELNQLIKEKIDDGMPAREAEKRAAREIIKGEIEKMQPRQFKETVHNKALGNLDVFLSLDSQQIRELVTKGSAQQRNILRKHGFTGTMKKQAPKIEIASKYADVKKAKKNKDSYRESV